MTDPMFMPGPSSVRIMSRGAWVMLVASLLVVPLAIVSSVMADGRRYALILLGILVVGLIVGLAILFSAFRKRADEIVRGYTPWKSAAVSDPGLVLVDARTLAPIVRRVPGTPGSGSSSAPR